MDRNEEHTFERVTRSIRLMKSLIGDYGGRVMNVAGDGVLALFESAPEALGFAVAIQQELRNDVVWAADDEPVAFQIGINLGEVLLDDETNIQGRSVDLAVRIQPFAPPGGICLSAAVRDVVQGSPGIILRSLGLKMLKNIAEPVEVFVVERETPSPAAVVVLLYALIGQIDEAKYHARQVMACRPNFSIEHRRNVPPDKNPEPLERFIDGLRMAGLS